MVQLPTCACSSAHPGPAAAGAGSASDSWARMRRVRRIWGMLLRSLKRGPWGVGVRSHWR
eukprot:874773-Pelagomonas_calceolata.AAC.1